MKEQKKQIKAEGSDYELDQDASGDADMVN